MRSAYFVSSYASPHTLLRLLRTLRAGDPDALLVVHHDCFRSDLDKDELAAVGGVHLLTSDAPVQWGDMSLEAARWRVFAWMVANTEFDWVVLLSEQDYPIRPLNEFSAWLAGTGADVVMEAQRLSSVPDRSICRENQRRYLYQFATIPRPRWSRRLPAAVTRRMRVVRIPAFRVINKVQSLLRIYWFPAALELPTKIGVRARRSPFGPDFPCWINTPWFALSRKAVERLCAYLREHPEFARYYERTVIPLESATATVVANDRKLTLLNEPLHHIRWSRPTTGRPDVLGIEDLDALSASGRWFARKFDLDDAAILDALDERIIPKARSAGVRGAVPVELQRAEQLR